MSSRPSFVLAAFLALACAGPVSAAPYQVHLGLAVPTDSTMTVTWRSTEPTGQVEYGETEAYGKTVAASSKAYQASYLHEAQLTGLSPATTYHYRVGAGASLAPDRTFTTGPAISARASLRFAAYGDSRTDDAARARVRAAVQARQPAFSVDSGDLVESGAVQAQWDQWFTTMEPLLAVSPFVSVVGNHEVNSPLFYEQFAIPQRDGGAETYSSFDYGNVHVLLLNTEIAYGAGSAQYQWLEADLARSAADPRVRWTVAVFHRPPYSSGGHGSDVGVREAWSALFEKYGVDLAFNGHDHHYERSFAFANGVPQPDGAGVVYVVTGGAGAPLYGVGTSSFTAASRSVHHFVELDVTPTELVLEARDADGNVFDTLTLRNDAALPVEAQPADPGLPPVDPPLDGSDRILSRSVTSGGCGVAGRGGVAVGSLLALVLLAVPRARRRRR
jgi:hypothetical protein